MLLSNFLIFLISLAAVIFSSAKVVKAVSRLAYAFRISPFMIALTIVAIGTSLPELTTAIISSLSNQPTIPLGNILGANIANIGLSIGLASILFAIDIKKKLFAQDITTALLVAIGLFIITSDAQLSREEGILMLFFFLCYLIHLARSQHHGLKQVLKDLQKPSPAHPLLTLLILLVCLAVLTTAAKFLLSSLLGLAEDLGVASEVVALTLLSLGTTTPELSVTLAAARKNNVPIALGTILGSNIINVLLILGLAAAISPIPISHFIRVIALPAFILLTGLLYHYIHESWFKRVIEGAILLILYMVFLLATLILA